ncbi:endonuclease/exonuclease/phosphatase family protein [Paenibacillus aurantius]|uniref:Endonuclease/exonuclease/phosphatase family protein n=1 Tax=Paenibacillus aurantius TaxID=2918900 RepID=A0AA96RCT4_9BACL|nr:endonuclease/exonuclease/phosphatase family protein [Paenibacillus aurantius]WNQ09042.1 endonuclease/exonuclease/phosphatase family protein [Paenibacillus aurantius]
MTFNLRYSTPNDGENAWPYRFHRAAEAIREHAPLLIGTQEGYLAMLNELAEQLPGYGWIGEGRFGGGENEHSAIFYRTDRLEVVDQGQFWLSETPEVISSKSWNSYFPRICTWGRFRLKDSGQEWMAYNTHLDHASGEAREKGAGVIGRMVAEHRQKLQLPILLMGDMNSYPADPAIQLFERLGQEEGEPWLTNAYTLIEGPVGLTAHSFQGGADGEPIDYIFASREFVFQEVKVDREQRDGGYPSDHYPIVARVGIKE